MADPGRIDGRITATHGAAAAGLGGAGSSQKPDKTFVFGGTRDANGNPVAPGFAGKHPASHNVPPAFDAGVAPDSGSLDTAGFTTPVGFVFNEGTVVIPSALFVAVGDIADAANAASTQTVTAVAIPYVTFDGEDENDSPIQLTDYSLTDAWVTDYQWLSDNGCVFNSTDLANLDPTTCARAMGLTGIDEWGFLGSVTLDGGNTLLVFSTVPGFFATDTLTLDATAVTAVFNTGTWEFTAINGTGPFTQYLYTEEGGVNAPLPLDHGVLMIDGSYTGHSEIALLWSDIIESTPYTFRASQFDRLTNDAAEFITGQTDPVGLDLITSGPLADICVDHEMRLTDYTNGSWIQGLVTNLEALNFDQDLPPNERPLNAITCTYTITAMDLSGLLPVEQIQLSGGNPVEGDHILISWEGEG
jgi:hypothetical protein